jgi:hypothetical protein
VREAEIKHHTAVRGGGGRTPWGRMKQEWGMHVLVIFKCVQNRQAKCVLIETRRKFVPAILKCLITVANLGETKI